MYIFTQEEIRDFAQGIAALKGRAYLVGGSVRDKLLGLEINDFDVEVHFVSPAVLDAFCVEFAEERGLKINSVGRHFTVTKIGSNLDISIPRKEQKVGVGHKAFTVEGCPDLGTFEASRRRDFTVNAMMEDVLTGEIIDHFGGREDLKDRILRVVDPKTFVEDSLRVLRAVQFIARFNMIPDLDAVRICRSIELDDLPKERIWKEIEKMLLAPFPTQGLRALMYLGVESKLFPDLYALTKVPQDKFWHPEGDVHTHTEMVLKEARKLINDLPHEKKITVMLAALCHDLGKLVTTKEEEDGRITSHGHSEAGLPMTEKLLDTLGVHTINNYPVRNTVLNLVKLHLEPPLTHRLREQSNYTKRIKKLALQVELDLLCRVSKADVLGRGKGTDGCDPTSEPVDWFRSEAERLAVEKEPEPKILTGKHLIEMGYVPSKMFGQVLDFVYNEQLDGHITTLDQAKVSAIGMFKSLELTERQ